MAFSMAAVVVGSSSSVGQALVRELMLQQHFASITTIVRQPHMHLHTDARALGTQLKKCVVPNLSPQSLGSATLEALRALEGPAVAFSALGVGAGTAHLSIKQHRAVDVDLNGAFALAARDSARVDHMAFLSAVGANPNASEAGSGAPGLPRYNWVKGEAEEAVIAQGPKVVSVFRPALILGSRHTPWILAKTLPMVARLLPKRYRPISAQHIAQAMVAAALHPPAATAFYHHKDMMALRRS